MSIIVYAAMLVAWFFAVKRGPGQSMLLVYLPCLLLIPDFYRCVVSGLPHLSFNQAAIVPVFVVGWLAHSRGFRPSLMDGMVLLFGVWVGLSDTLARGFTESKNLIVAMVCSVVMPYLCARLIIPAEKLDVKAGRAFVFMVFIAAVVGLFEFKLAYNPFHATWGKLFAGQGSGWVTTFRHGVPRVAGPYSHAILAGIVMMMAYRLQRWLDISQHWEPRFARLPSLPASKARIITVSLLIGLIMTVARGPWIGALVAAAIGFVGQAKDRKKALTLSATILGGGGIVGFFLLQSYLDIRPGMAMTQSQESALYRKILFEQYLDIALSHAWLGWGMTDWPKVRGMESIDNYFLLLSLQHGLVATGLLLGMMLLGTAQSLVLGMRHPAGSSESVLAFTFAGIFMAVLVSLGTVYFGEQAMPAFFFILGWAQGARFSTHGHRPTQAVESTTQVSPGRFRKVIS